MKTKQGSFFVEESKFFQENIKSYQKEIPRINDVVTGIKWKLERNPLSSDVLSRNYRVFTTTGYSKTPRFSVIFSIEESEKKIVLEAISEVDESDND